MADYEDVKVTDLVINNISQEKYDELKTAGQLEATQIYLTPTEEGGGGLTAVAHDSTLTGTGTNSSPLGIASTVLAEIADKAEQTTVETLSGVVSQNTTNIGTLRTDVDDLGDQVSGIESKIPASASSTNLLATKSEIPTVPTNVSAFNNDSGYITSSALTPYATTQALNDGLATKQPTGDYATNSALTSGLALKVAIAQGSENAGKILKIDDNGNVIVADESGGGANLPILYHTWSDHLLNNISWLRADTFSWQSGDVYKAAYEHLVSDLEGTTAESETISGVTIVFYRAEDGHKICTASHESLVRLLYDVTGVAWYFILDTENKQFKLPRTKYGFTGLRDSVGGYVEPGLPNITGQVGQIDFSGSRSFSGAFINVSSPSGDTGATHAGGTRTTVGFDASNSSAIYGNSDTVQPPATQMYLYFYVGNFEQSAIEQTAGITAETLNGKADTDLGNIPANYDYVVESQLPTSANGYTWYRKYKSGWVEQGGVGIAADAAHAFQATFPIVMADTNYTILAISKTPSSTTASTPHGCHYLSKTTTRCNIISLAGNSGNWVVAEVCWQVSGMSAQ